MESGLKTVIAGGCLAVLCALNTMDVSAENGSPAKKNEKTRVAIQTLLAKGVSPTIAGAITDIVKSYIVNTRLFEVVEREQMDKILNEIGFQQTGCTDNACAVEVGKLLSAQKMVMGEISRVGDSYILGIRMVDVADGTSEHSSSIRADSDERLDAAATKLAKGLTESYKRTQKGFFTALWFDIRSSTRNQNGYYARSLVPGWGQYYAGSEGKGYVLMGAAAAALAFAGYAKYDFIRKDNAYHDLGTTDPISEYDNRASTADKAARTFNISLGVLLAVYVAHWLDAIWFTELQPESACTMRPGNGFYAGIGRLPGFVEHDGMYFNAGYHVRF